MAVEEDDEEEHFWLVTEQMENPTFVPQEEEALLFS
jgi:hypothetical protein